MANHAGPVPSTRPLFYGWIIVAASFVILFAYVFMSNSAGVFFKPMLTEMGWSRGTTAAAFAISTLISGVAAPWMGILSDKYGPRLMEIVSAVFLAGGFALTAFSHSLLQLYVSYGLLIGLASGAMWTPVAATVACWFEARRGFAISLVQAGAGLGTIVGPPLSTYVIYRWDWRFAFLVLGVTMGLLTFVGAQFLRSNPQAMGLLPDGGYKRMAAAKATTRSIPSARNVSVGEALRGWPFWQVFSVHGVGSFAQQIIVVHLVAAATDREITPAVAATFFSVAGITNITGKLVMGYVSDRIGRRISLTISLSLAVAAMLWLSLASVPWMFYVFALVWGFAYGSWIPMFPAITGDLFGVRSLGGIFGLITMGNAIGGAAGAFVAGAIFDKAQSYTFVFFLAAALLVAGIVLVLLLKDPKRQGRQAASSMEKA